MTTAHDAVVVGIGGMGSAALYHLARRGLRVVGLERFGIAHDRGSSHGESRILRLAYFENPAYVPLSRRALDLWHALERESGERLFLRTGGIDGGPEDDALFQGALESCRLHGLEHEVLDGAALRDRHPGFRFPRRDRFVYQPEAGVLHPERCIEAHARMAEAMGAELRTGTRVVGWEGDGSGVLIHLDGGDEVRAGVLVLTAGPWTAELLPQPPRLRVERQVVAWLAPEEPERFTPERFPIFNVQVGGGHHYGFPSLEGRGPKVGRFGHLRESADPDGLRREATTADRALLQGFADLHLHRAGTIADTAPCMFTHTLDTDFIVDRVPGHPAVVGCGFSGHGFKFASVIGETLAALAAGEAPPLSVDHLAWDRASLRRDGA